MVTNRIVSSTCMDYIEENFAKFIWQLSSVLASFQKLPQNPYLRALYSFKRGSTIVDSRLNLNDHIERKTRCSKE